MANLRVGHLRTCLQLNICAFVCQVNDICIPVVTEYSWLRIQNRFRAAQIQSTIAPAQAVWSENVNSAAKLPFGFTKRVELGVLDSHGMPEVPDYFLCFS